jgi:hypothetical protein
MTDYTAQLVEALLARHELAGPEFDAAEIAADLNARTEMNDGLDALLGSASRPDPTAFDPRWDE